MTKREILKWLEAKRDHTLLELYRKHNMADAELRDQVIADSGLPAVADQMEALIDQAMKLWRDWTEQHTAIDGLSTKEYSRIEGYLSYYVEFKGATLPMLSAHELTIQTTEMVRLEKEYRATREKTRRSYDNVIAAVDSMPKAALATAYLKELGFDLTEIEPAKQPATVLTVQIDKHYLFLKKAA